MASHIFKPHECFGSSGLFFVVEGFACKRVGAEPQNITPSDTKHFLELFLHIDWCSGFSTNAGSLVCMLLSSSKRVFGLGIG